MDEANLSSPSLMPLILDTGKTYVGKKKNLLGLALKSSKAAIVKGIVNLDVSLQEQIGSQTSTMQSSNNRRIAVFGESSTHPLF